MSNQASIRMFSLWNYLQRLCYVLYTQATALLTGQSVSLCSMRRAESEQIRFLRSRRAASARTHLTLQRHRLLSLIFLWHLLRFFFVCTLTSFAVGFLLFSLSLSFPCFASFFFICHDTQEKQRKYTHKHTYIRSAPSRNRPFFFIYSASQ